ncbi:MAG: hypothetical protein CMM56_01210 [Rhodospirillaceae bacterium]|nr:hypothetical protein [Rhodospirillaceae bacterium]|tara:strand:+ start:19452 stop:20495 length:1044 start_codon:yes stop_codon:yes gene_type:complete
MEVFWHEADLGIDLKKTICILFCIFLTPLSGVSHHAFSGIFDMSNLIELEGQITRLLWRNPHVKFTMLDTNDQLWEIETNSVSILSRMNVSSDLLAEGDRVTVAGYPARSGVNEMWVNNILLADGRELVTRPGTNPYWSVESLGESETWLSAGVEGGEDLGIFRVWSTRFNGPGRYMYLEEYPLTETAIAAQEAFNPLVDNPIGECTPKGMPWIMQQPYPVKFSKEGDNILFHIEEYDLVRTIHMGEEQIEASIQPALLGYSVGSWDGEDLVVSTHSVDWYYFNSDGIPQSSRARFEERFSLSENGVNLDYTIIVSDPETFTEPVKMTKQWVWRAGETVNPYVCTNF